MAPARISKFRKIENAIYTSGVTGKPGDAPTQIRNVFEKLEEVLSEAGTDFRHVVKAIVYLSDLSDREKYLNDIWNEYFPDEENCPARTTVEVGLGGDTLVEIEMVAEA